MTSPTQRGEREEALMARLRKEAAWQADHYAGAPCSELLSVAADTIERHISSAKAEGEMREVLKAHEKWEADLILSDATVPQSLWDRLIEVQALRNAALYPEPVALSPEEDDA
jgi:hypothetical protein